ncbi:ATP synthase, F1 gamma subunit [Halobacteroides halobius DSM 5150]|uniref:ATP synthase gamma chain n=1 Tax=Halobacteroides halobius (strain ATCC 35273 / DSM 5150 / MD-1) TaxID=748449 RepID=L0KE40_HALHC|nr:ATP synthase F1 subunit gamma [Halobacteroides halobius]AGB42333.1 ATP synthase, F1 gamma subunit [Halobacteroides halobius DSM 5150]
MESMRDIKRQINSVKNTKKITRAMNMVAAAKLQKAEKRADEAKPFFNKTKETLVGIASGVDDLHPLLEQREVDKVGYVMITGDRGLCGPYNSRVIKEVESQIEEADQENALITIGKKAKNYFRNTEVEMLAEYIGIEDNPSFSTATNIAHEAIELYQEEVLDKVHLVYTEFNSVLDQKVKTMQLLPIEPPEEDIETESFLYEPSAEAVLEAVLPQYVKNIIFGSLLQSKASEFASRMTAMDSATENAEEMIEELTLSYNRARQAAITQELTEIVGGAEALD